MEGNSSNKLIAVLRLHAGGSWVGHTWIEVTHPISKSIIGRCNLIEEAEKICEDHNLLFDETIREIIHINLIKKDGVFVVPEEKLDKSAIISSCSKYLKDIQKDHLDFLDID